MSHWIFLRGLTRESRHWGGFPEAFRQAMPDASIHMPDLPGNGCLYSRRSPPKVEEMAEACRAGLLRQGVRPPYHLLAMSLGAMAGIAWAARHPGEVRCCVLINTSARPFAPFYRRLRPGSYLPLVELAMHGGDARARESVILRLTSRQAEHAGELLDDWVAYREQFPVSMPNALRQLLAAARYRAPEHPPQSQFLILASRGDALVHPSCSRLLAQRWNAAFAEHPSAGHDLPLDDGQWIIQQVQAWLRTLP